MLISGWTTPYGLLQNELIELEYEGYEVPGSVKSAFAELDPVADAVNEEKLNAVRDRLAERKRRSDFPYVEPNDLAEIRAERPPVRPVLPAMNLTREELLDRFHGAWLGRCVGCALGKPVEGMGMGGCRWRDIRRYLRNRGDWPLKDYFSRKDVGDGMTLGCPHSCRESIAFMESDDDIRYTLIGLLILERYGKDFTSEQVAQLWNTLLPMRLVCTAETQALLNFNLHRAGWSFDKEFTRRFNNPYREWIGAQIRADFFGFAAAGDPELAADFAWRDASWTHTANGIYGEMFFAALGAAAFAEPDFEKQIASALAEIPVKSRLAEGIRNALKVLPSCSSMEDFMRWLEREYEGMSPVHTVNNALICVAALFLGQGDPDRSVCEAVMGGLDTDCNGATVGAIAGIMAGRRRFGGTLAGRLNDTIHAEFGEFWTVRMEDLAKRTLAVYDMIQRRRNG